MRLTTARFVLPLLAGLLFLLQACVEEYVPSIESTANVLVVEGNLTDLPEPQFVRITRSEVFEGKSYTRFIKGVQAEVLANGSAVALRETIPGRYEAPEGFRAQVGNRYQLRFRFPDGTPYESSVEVMPAVPRLEKVYDQFDEKAIAGSTNDRFTPANVIYVDTQDPPGERNFYRWDWTLWESQIWCATCQRSTFVVSDPATGDGTCVGDRFIDPGQIYDYTCISPCWDVFQGVSLNVFADTYSNGKSIRGRQVAQIPYYQSQPALVEIRQYALTAAAYRYYDLLDKQTQSTGGLADTPPAPIVGNVRNLANERENIAGYFTASGVAPVRYWLDRRNATTLSLGLFYSLFGRPPIPEPRSVKPNGETRPPFVRCVPGENRTPVQPAGWRS